MPIENKLSFAAVCFAIFLRGVDYGVVMPSMWKYLQLLDHDASEIFYGITIASFSASSMILSPIFGLWLDKRPMKEVMIFLTILSGLGSALYALSFNIWMVFIARIVTGIGSICWTAANLYVVLSTSREERSSVFAIVNMIFVIALAAGPAINFPVTKLTSEYHFGPFVFSQLSSPGEPRKPNVEISKVIINEGDNSVKILTSEHCLSEWKKIFGNFPCVVIIIVNTLSVFVQTSLEAIIAPVTQAWYNFDNFWNSVLYAGITVLMITWFICIGVVSKRVSDRAFLLSGHILNGCATSTFIYFLGVSPNLSNFFIPIWQFCLVCGIYSSAIPLYKSTINSLFSKLLNDSTLDGRGQSVMSSSSSLGAIIGPLISGFFLSFDIRWLQVTSMGLWAVVFLLILFAWSSMYVKKEFPPELVEVKPDPSTQRLLHEHNDNDNNNNSNTRERTT